MGGQLHKIALRHTRDVVGPEQHQLGLQNTTRNYNAVTFSLGLDLARFTCVRLNKCSPNLFSGCQELLLFNQQLRLRRQIVSQISKF